jgi:hypothetical protein
VPELRHALGAQWKLLQVCQLREHKRLLLRARGTGWMSRNGSTNVLQEFRPKPVTPHSD